jgi:hypothetical protein
MENERMVMYYSLILVVGIFLWGFACFFLQPDIKKNNKLYKYRPKSNSLLLRLKLFKDNERFNYFLLIPYILSWVIFIVIFCLYCLYWFGVPYMQDILYSTIFLAVLLGIYFMYMLYIAVMKQVIINLSSSVSSTISKKDEQSRKIAEDEIKRALKDSKTKSKDSKDGRSDKNSRPF